MRKGSRVLGPHQSCPAGRRGRIDWGLSAVLVMALGEEWLEVGGGLCSASLYHVWGFHFPHYSDGASEWNRQPFLWAVSGFGARWSPSYGGW